MKRIDIIGGFGIIGKTIQEVSYGLDIKTWGINPNSYGYFDLLDEKVGMDSSKVVLKKLFY